MTELNNEPVPQNLIFSGSYALVTDVSKLDIQGHPHNRLAHLETMLTVICGEGFELFKRWSDERKCEYLSGAAMIAQECKELSEALNAFE